MERESIKQKLVWKASRKIDGGKYSEFRRHIPPSRRHTGTTNHVHHTQFPPPSSAPQPSISSRAIPRSSVIPPVFNLGQDPLPSEHDEVEFLRQQNNKKRVQRSNQFPGHHLTTITPETQPVRPRPTTKKQPHRRHGSNVILEYTITQGEYVIDAVVVKEPFRDRFEVYGIDVLSGQRFELFIPSEAVFDILSGDMLVTSIEKPEVWREVVQRITLSEVDRFSRTGRIPHRKSYPTSYSQSLLDGEEEGNVEGEEYDSEILNISFPLENQTIWSIHDAGDSAEEPAYSLMEQPETVHEKAVIAQPQPQPPPRSDTKKRSDKPIHSGRGIVEAAPSDKSVLVDLTSTDDKEGLAGGEMEMGGPETTQNDVKDSISAPQPPMRVINAQSVEEDAALTTVMTGAVANENPTIVSEAVNNKEAEAQVNLAPVNVLADATGQTTTNDVSADVNSSKNDGVNHTNASTGNKKVGNKLQPTKPSPSALSVVHKPRPPVTVISSKRRKGKGTTTKKQPTDDVIETTVGLKSAAAVVVPPLPSTVSPSGLPQQQQPQQQQQQPSVETKAVTFAEEVVEPKSSLQQQEIPNITLDSHLDPTPTHTAATESEGEEG